MFLHVKFESQLRRLAGFDGMSLDLQASCSLEQIVRQVAKEGTEPLRNALLDEQQSLRASILIFLDNELVSHGQSLDLKDGSELTVTTLISGG